MADLAGSNGLREVFRIAGKPNLPGKLAYSLATGRAKFGADYVMQAMFHAKFLRCPYANAVARSVAPGKVIRPTSLESQIHPQLNRMAKQLRRGKRQIPIRILHRKEFVSSNSSHSLHNGGLEDINAIQNRIQQRALYSGTNRGDTQEG